MDTFKGQGNNVVLNLCKKHFFQVVIVPHNLTNKFQPLDITVNKPAKSFISNKYNEWFAEQVAKQLQKGIPPADIQVSLNLGELNGYLRYMITFATKKESFSTDSKQLVSQKR